MIFGYYSFLPNLIKVSSGHSKNRKALMPPVLCPIPYSVVFLRDPVTLPLRKDRKAKVQEWYR